MHTHCFEAAQGQPAVHWCQASSLRVLQEVQLLAQLRVPYCQHAQCCIAVAADVLCTACHADVSTQLQGSLVKWGEEAVVHAHQGTSGMCDGHNGGNVAHLCSDTGSIP